MIPGSCVILRVEMHDPLIKLIVVLFNDDSELSLGFGLCSLHPFDDPSEILEAFLAALSQALKYLIVKGYLGIFFDIQHHFHIV